MTEISSGKIKILRASAGSGKTFRLAYEFIRRIVVDPSSYNKILAVTFTNKACEEMKNRILSRLSDLGELDENQTPEYLNSLLADTDLQKWEIKNNAKRARTLILHDYSNFSVTTIDKFFQKIARSFFKELGLNFNYEVELSNDNYLRRAIEIMVQKSGDNKNLERALDVTLIKNLENNHWNVVSKELITMAKELTFDTYQPNSNSPDELIATMQHAMRVRDEQYQGIVMLAQKAVQTIESIGLVTKDFAQGERGFVAFLYKIIRTKELPKVNSYFTKAVQSENSWYSKTSSNKGLILSIVGTLKPILEAISEQINSFIVINNSVAAVNQSFHHFILLQYINSFLEDLWREDNRVPLFKTTKLISDITENSDIPFIYEKIGARYHTYMIDEFQDTSITQWKGFIPLISEAISSSAEQCVLLIGDVKQAIYSFRGGDWSILANKVAQEFKYDADFSEKLNTNYRSLKNIIQFNNALIENIITQESANLSVFGKYKSQLQDAYGDDYAQEARPDADGGYVEVAMTDDNLTKTIETIKHLIDNQGYNQKDIAVLVRTKDKSTLLANELTQSGYSVVSDEALKVKNADIIKFLISTLRYSTDRTNILTLSHINHSLGRDMDAELADNEAKMLSQLIYKTPTQALDNVIEFYSLQDNNISYIQALYEAFHTQSTTNFLDVRAIVEWWDENSDKLSLTLPQGQDAITIITIHKAKGLQYPVVIMPWGWKVTPKGNLWVETDQEPLETLGKVTVNYNNNLDQSLFNDQYQQINVASHIDNMNMLYVAITRAERELYIFTANKQLKNSTDELIANAVATIKHIKFDDTTSTYSLGEKTKANHNKKEPHNVENIVFNHFSSTNTRHIIATNLPHYRKHTDQAMTLSDRHYGLIMHSIFSTITNLNQVENEIQNKLKNGELTLGILDKLRLDIDKAATNNYVKDWFSGNYKVFAERAILQTAGENYRRPDRVMIGDNKVIVVDYKFGRLKQAEHHQQVNDYCKLLRSMGHNNVEGYIWYVSLGEVEKV